MRTQADALLPSPTLSSSQIELVQIETEQHEAINNQQAGATNDQVCDAVPNGHSMTDSPGFPEERGFPIGNHWKTLGTLRRGCGETLGRMYFGCARSFMDWQNVAHQVRWP
jgi:hypothetical protein